MFNILIVDDHQLVGEGTKDMIEKENEFNVQYIADSYNVLTLETIFDLYIIDIHMPELSGIELSQKLLEQNKDVKIILYTGVSWQEDLTLFTKIGISGIIDKTATKGELMALIHAVLSGYTIVPLSIFKYNNDGMPSDSFELTENEQIILQYVCDGLSNREIGCKLFLSGRTVEYQLTKIYKSLNVKRRSEAIRKVIKLGIIS